MMSVGYHEYTKLAKENKLYEYHSIDEVDPDYLTSIFPEDGSDSFHPDILTPLKEGKSWLYEGMSENMPLSGAVLQGGGELFVAGLSDHGFGHSLFFPELYQVVGQVLINVTRSLKGNHWGDSPVIDAGFDHRLEALPKYLRDSYYYRSLGFGIAKQFPERHARWCLPKDVGSMYPICDYLKSLRRFKKDIAFFREVIPGLAPESRDWYPYFFCLLDAGNADYSDRLFMKSHIKDDVVYYIRDDDTRGMMVLNNPQEAIDRCCEHALLNKEGRFDFMPYAEKLS